MSTLYNLRQSMQLAVYYTRGQSRGHDGDGVGYECCVSDGERYMIMMTKIDLQVFPMNL